MSEVERKTDPPKSVLDDFKARMIEAQKMQEVDRLKLDVMRLEGVIDILHQDKEKAEQWFHEIARLTSALEAAERGLEHAKNAKLAIESAMIMSTTSQQWKRISKAHSELILAIDGCLAEIAEIKGSK